MHEAAGDTSKGNRSALKLGGRSAKTLALTREIRDKISGRYTARDQGDCSDVTSQLKLTVSQATPNAAVDAPNEPARAGPSIHERAARRPSVRRPAEFVGRDCRRRRRRRRPSRSEGSAGSICRDRRKRLTEVDRRAPRRQRASAEPRRSPRVVALEGHKGSVRSARKHRPHPRRVVTRFPRLAWFVSRDYHMQSERATQTTVLDTSIGRKAAVRHRASRRQQCAESHSPYRTAMEPLSQTRTCRCRQFELPSRMAGTVTSRCRVRALSLNVLHKPHSASTSATIRCRQLQGQAKSVCLTFRADQC